VDHKEHVKTARFYLEEAYKLLERGDVYDAAEKAGAAVKHATIALTTALLKEAAPPRGVPWRTFVKNALVKAGLNEDEASSWASYYIDVRDRLHGGCFYGLTYEETEHRPLIERAKDYIDLIEKLLKQRQGE
jgi:HEPN domain-containing protein